jgi:hypothetical protein
LIKEANDATTAKATQKLIFFFLQLRVYRLIKEANDATTAATAATAAAAAAATTVSTAESGLHQHKHQLNKLSVTQQQLSTSISALQCARCHSADGVDFAPVVRCDDCDMQLCVQCDKLTHVVGSPLEMHVRRAVSDNYKGGKATAAAAAAAEKCNAHAAAATALQNAYEAEKDSFSTHAHCAAAAAASRSSVNADVAAAINALRCEIDALQRRAAAAAADDSTVRLGVSVFVCSFCCVYTVCILTFYTNTRTHLYTHTYTHTHTHTY